VTEFSAVWAYIPQPEHVRLVRWLYARAWVSAERPSMLFDLATARLVERKVLLPGVTTLARLVARVRDRVAARLWETLAAAPNDVQRARLERLVVVPVGQRVSPLEQLGRSPTRANAAGLVGALKRLGAFQVLDAVAYLRDIEGQKAPDMLEAPLAVVPPAWRRLVVQTVPTYRVDRKAYTFALLEQLQVALKRHDVFVAPSEKWADPRAKLLQGAAWEAARPQVCRGLGHTTDATAEMDTLSRHLDERYRRTASNLARNPFVRVEREKGRDTVVISPLEKLDEPASLLKLRDGVQARLPRVDLSDVILEVQRWTGFADAFTHISEGNARVHDLTTSICAVLLAEACNIGLEPLIRPDVPALTRGRLEWVQQNYIRAETIAPANAVLGVYAQTPEISVKPSRRVNFP